MREGGYKIIDFKNKSIEEVTRWDVIRDDIINSDGKSILISGLKYGGKVLNDFCTTVEVNAQNYIFLTIIATSTKCVDLVIMEDEAIYRYYYLDQIDKKIADGDKTTLTSAKSYADEKDKTTLTTAKKYTDDQITAKALTKSDLNAFKTECYEHNNVIYLGDLTAEEVNTITALETGKTAAVRTGAVSNAVWNCKDIQEVLFVQLRDPIGNIADNPSMLWLIADSGMASATKGYINSWLLPNFNITIERTSYKYIFDVYITGSSQGSYTYDLTVSKKSK
mgnify:CR=1 FL=1